MTERKLEINYVAACGKALWWSLAIVWIAGWVVFFGLMMVVVIFYVVGIDDWLVMKLLGFDYDFELQQFLRETKISYDRLSSIALRSFTYGALALVSVTVIGFGGYIAKKAFDTDLASQRDQIWRNWELDKIVANFPDSSKEAYGELLEVNGCGSATAKRIIEKCENRRELTEHEIDILSKAGLYGLSLYHHI